MKEIREIREIKNDHPKKEEPKGYLEIKPETDLTMEGAQEFWNSIFGGIDSLRM